MQYTILTRIFSIKNINLHKVITVLGIKFKLKNKKLIQQEQMKKFEQNFQKSNKNLEQKLQKLENIIIQQKSELQNLEKFITQQNLELINYEKENFYSNVLNMSWYESEWVNDKKFSLTGGAANYSFIYVLFCILEKISPQRILEFGLGQTTKLTTQYVNNKRNDAMLDVIEHSQDWIDYFSNQLNLTENIKIYHRDLTPVFINNAESDKYKDLEAVIGKNKYNLIIIDGPIGFKKNYPRTNIIDLLPQNLAEDFVIVLDDAERIGEKNTAKLIFEKLDACNIKYKKSYKAGLKTQLLITSENYNFIHWI